MKGWLRALAPYLTSLVVHAVVGGGLAVGTLFVARTILAPEPMQVELVVSAPRQPEPEPDPAKADHTPDRTPRAPPQKRLQPPPRKRKLNPPRTLADLPRDRPLPERAERVAMAQPQETVPSTEPLREGPAAPAVFGLSMDSANAGGGTFAVAVGNTVATSPSNTGPVQGERGRPPTTGLVAPPEALPKAEEDFRITQWPTRQDDLVFPYPEEARRGGTEGSVRLRLWLDERGRVVRADLAAAANAVLDAAALANVKRLRFSPARAGKKAVPCELAYTFTFVLD